MLRKTVAILAALALSMTVAACDQEAEEAALGPVPKKETDRFITIGTAGVTGVYYPAGGSICRLVNKGRKDHGIRCTVESTNGSVYNVRTIRGGDLTLGVVQSDWHHHGVHGTGPFVEDGPYEDLRSVFSLHPEPFTVVARADSGITNLAGLKGKRVNMGNPGSGQRGTMEVVMAALGWTSADFALAAELRSSEQSKALCENKIDAMVFTVGHPSGSIMEATTSCESRLIEVSGAAIDRLVQDNIYYRHAVVPGGMYRGNQKDVKTFGVGATVVTSASVSEDTIYQLVKAVFEDFAAFKDLHPAFANLSKPEMVRAGLSAPLHAGARRYYREVGLIR
ncbi:TAXI family TRAP transporter solute-binding subunit [Magnetospira sp. QH-2]|uniref:TAXI family TRAP transporter solute-binding subunit n=1 Tax=Magnetospira sp. (strain QH-2) TaxID=1288970 RepID=UPI0003E81569|nr:TAXI family TRAP transporter solute-binding subunit [Magnetospira sp. QH-2]CCQ73910.1 TRAP transporter solute receptor, TAXI family protein [Magnetospira sp. QH-2]